jgi:hypothetical protein
MTAPVITPLRKKNGENILYVRPSNITSQLAAILLLDRPEILARCAIRDRKDPSYLPSECLLYLIRSNRGNEPDTYFETLYKNLVERVIRTLPSEEETDLTQRDIRHESFEDFVELLARDRLEYVERLDFFEIRFDKSLVSLRTDVKRRAYTDKKHYRQIEVDEKTGRYEEDVERAARDFNPFESKKIDDPNYRLSLDKAIDSLPTLQKAIVIMMKTGIPIESQDPETMTISKALQKSEKTIRTHRDKAILTLRVALTESEAV